MYYMFLICDIHKLLLLLLLLLLFLLLLAMVTYNQVQSYQVNLLQQIIKTAKYHCCAFMALDKSIREVNYYS